MSSRSVPYPIPALTILLVLVFSLTADGQLAKNKCKFLGNIIGNQINSDFSKYWNQVTPENSGKWGSVESTRDVMNWAGLDAAYTFAKNNSLPFKQHTLVWGQQQPGWMSSLSLIEQKEEVEEWIKAFCDRYPDTDFIDVVNEPLHAVPEYSPALGGSGATGWDWVIWSFEKTRQYCPTAKLVLNDYNIISSDGATGQYITIINLLKERSLIDIVGEQGHFLETTPLSTVTGNLNRLQSTGLPIHISEFDLNFSDDTQQRSKYETLFPLLWDHPAVEGITLWGYRQGQIWRENAYLVRTSGTERPAMTWLKSFVPSSHGGNFCVTVGTEDEQQPEVTLFPNPTREAITIRTNRYPVHLTILDRLSRAVTTRVVVSDEPVPLGLSPGIYLIELEHNPGRSHHRIRIE